MIDEPPQRTVISESPTRPDSHWWLRWILDVDELPGGPWEVENEEAWPPRQVIAAGKNWFPPLEAPGSTFAWRTFHRIGTEAESLDIRVTPFETAEQASDALSRFPREWRGSVEDTGIDWHSRIDRASNGVVVARRIPVDARVPSCQGVVASILLHISSVIVYGESVPDWDLLLAAAAAQVQKIRRTLADQA